MIDIAGIPCYAIAAKGREASVMRLYLVQHGEAKPKEEDAERPLTDQGRDDVARVADFARRADVEIHQIRHSGKRRAAETAAILAEHLEPGGGAIVWPGLAPKDEVAPVAELLSRITQPLMLVGHRPFMDRLAGLLLAGDVNRAVVKFRQGGIVCLERDPKLRTWAVVWAVTPDLIA
jgi:phosphohistidine phosphatase